MFTSKFTITERGKNAKQIKFIRNKRRFSYNGKNKNSTSKKELLINRTLLVGFKFGVFEVLLSEDYTSMKTNASNQTN